MKTIFAFLYLFAGGGFLYGLLTLQPDPLAAAGLMATCALSGLLFLWAGRLWER